MYFLVINLGLKSIRAIIFNEFGRKIKSVSQPISSLLKGGRVEQSPLEWEAKAHTVIKEVLIDDEVRKKIEYITVTSSSSCLLPVGNDGKPLYNCIMVSDKRSGKQVEKIRKTTWFTEASSNGSIKCNESLMIPKILWLKENEEEIYNKTFKFLAPNDYLIALFTGKYLTDPLNAEKFYYQLDDNSYPDQLLDEIGISKDKLPEVGSVGQEVGNVSKSFANDTRLLEKAKVHLTTYDAICAFWGSGGTEEGTTCEVSGTVTSIRVLTRDKLYSHALYTQYAGWGDMYLVGGSNNLGGGLIEWTKQAFYFNEEYSYEVMEKEAKDAPIGAGGLIFLPYLLGERAPLWDDTARGVFFGLERYHQRGNFVKSIFESTGFSVKSILQIIETLGIKVNQIRVSGGLSRIPYINKIKSDILNKQILVCEEFETTSLGAFMLLLIGVGLEKDITKTSKIVKIREVISPDPESVDIYNRIFILFQELYANLKPSFEMRNKLNREIYQEMQGKIENL